MAQFFHKDKKEEFSGGFNRFGTVFLIGLCFFWAQNARYPDKVIPVLPVALSILLTHAGMCFAV